MIVLDVVRGEQVHELFLVCRVSQVELQNGDDWVVFITLPVYADSLESDIHQCCCEASMATANFDCVNGFGRRLFLLPHVRLRF